MTALRQKQKQRRCPVGAYVRAAALRHKVVVVEGLEEITHELKGVGRNINQLVVLCNMGRIKEVHLDDDVAGTQPDSISNCRELAEQERTVMATVTLHSSTRSQSAGALQRRGWLCVSETENRARGRLAVGQRDRTARHSWLLRSSLPPGSMHRKDSPVWFYHYVQSFSPDEEITGVLAHQVAQEFAEQAWPDSEVLIATHTDAEHIHTHFIVNSVCYETGKMLRQGPSTLKNLRALSDELCMKYGFSVLEKQQPKKTKGMSSREYRSAAKGESWKFRLMNTIDQCMRYASTKEEFICSDGERGLRGALDGQPEEYHLHHTKGHEVPG